MTKLNRIKKSDYAKAILASYDYSPTPFESFLTDATAFCRATKRRELICHIVSVSRSGMSRRMRFMAMVPDRRGSYLRNFNRLFAALDYRENKRGELIVHGCGMDMVFATHYNLIYAIATAGVITEKQRDELAQMTPHKI